MFHKQSSNSIKQLKFGYKILGPTYGHLLQWKIQQDRRSSLTSISLKNCQVGVHQKGKSWTLHPRVMIRFGPLNFRPIKGLKTKLLSWQFTSFYNNFEMAAGHVVSRMIFQAITADRNARIEHCLNRRVSGKPFLSVKSTAKIPPKTRLESQQDGLLLLSPWFLTVRYLSVLWILIPCCCLQSS